MVDLAWKDGVLHLEGASLAEAARLFGTPLYLYSQKAMLRRLECLKGAFAGMPHKVCFAVKANSNLSILQALARAGSGFDIVSLGELAKVLAAGGDPAQVVFSGVGKKREEMAEALLKGIHCFNIESSAELFVLEEVARALGRPAPVAIRVNPGVEVPTHGHIATGRPTDKFGVEVNMAHALAIQASQSPHMRFLGLDMHVGSQVMDLEVFASALAKVVSLAKELKKSGIEVQHIDAGGGLGVGEGAPVLESWVKTVMEVISPLGAEAIIEPGRALVAEAGVLLTKVEYIKENGGVLFAVVDAGMNDFLRPALYGAKHPVQAVRQGPGIAGTYDVVGPVCESGDFLARQVPLAIAQGDFLAVGQAGAYAMSMSSNYNARPRPAEVMIEEGRMRLIRAREAFDDLMRHEAPFLL